MGSPQAQPALSWCKRLELNEIQYIPGNIPSKVFPGGSAFPVLEYQAHRTAFEAEGLTELVLQIALI